MLKLLKLSAWLVLGMVLLVGFDQFMLRVPSDLPGLKQAQTFYVDFRGRLFGLAGFDAPQSATRIEQVIDANKERRPEAAGKSSRYLYVDGAGILQFADSLQQVPEAYRQNAQPLAE